MDVDGDLPSYGRLGRGRINYEHTLVIYDGASARTHGGDVHVCCAVDRRILGTADLGNLVGVGCAADVGINFAFLVRRIYVAQRRH